MSRTCLFTFNWSNFFPAGNTFLPCLPPSPRFVSVSRLSFSFFFHVWSTSLVLKTSAVLTFSHLYSVVSVSLVSHSILRINPFSVSLSNFFYRLIVLSLPLFHSPFSLYLFQAASSHFYPQFTPSQSRPLHPPSHAVVTMTTSIMTTTIMTTTVRTAATTLRLSQLSSKCHCHRTLCPRIHFLGLTFLFYFFFFQAFFFLSFLSFNRPTRVAP